MLIQLFDDEIKEAVKTYVKKKYNLDVNEQDVKLRYDSMTEDITVCIIPQQKGIL